MIYYASIVKRWVKNSGLFSIIFVITFQEKGLGQCTPAQRIQDSLQLVALYNATNGPGWSYHSNWLSPQPLGNWFGVDVNAQGCVTSIDLGSNFLSNALPNLNLPNLIDLDLSYNNLNGFLPNFNLPVLEGLNLGFNDFTGSIPAFSLPNLKYIGLNNNQLTGSIPNFSQNSLLRISLSGNSLSGNIPNFNLPNLEYLYLWSNQITGSIPSFNLPMLADLIVRSNQLSGNVPNFTFPNLFRIDASDNNLTGSIPNFNLPNLVAIELQNNQLTGSIPNFNLPSLRNLSLYNNQLSGSIPSFNLPLMDQFYLQNNNLSGCYPAVLSAYCNVAYSLSNNPLLPWQGDFSQFCSGGTQIGAPCVNISTPGTDQILPNCSCSIITCTHPDKAALISLYNATDGDNWTNPWDTTNCNVCSWNGIICNGSSRVTEINLGFRGLNGTLPNFNIPFLQKINMVANQLTGLIPNFNLPALQSLDLQSNNITGPLPNLNLPNLKTLNVSFNDVTNNIPAFNLPMLEYLMLSSNQLTGSIPNFNFINLKHLSIEGNLLTGSIPAFNFPNLEGLYLMDNQLSGPIPDINSNNIIEIRLNLNNLTGPIPAFNKPNLRYIWITDNQLSGELPELNLPQILGMAFNNNNLSGCFPASYSAFCSNTYFTNNPLLPWQGDFSQFCSGGTQVGAPCDNSATFGADVIQSDCSCGLACASFSATPSGTATICNGNSTNVTFNFSAGTPPYDVTWTGGTLNGIFSGHTEPVSPSSTTTYSIISATDDNGCDATPSGSVTVTVNSTLNVGSVSGPVAVCQGATNSYSVSTVAGGTSYDWTVPTGAIITNTPPYNNSITVNWPAGSISGDVCCAANNSCGTGNVQCRTITFTPIPAAPAVIYGPAQVCINTSQSFNVDPVPDAVSYTWTVPTGATITSGQGTINIIVSFGASAQSGNICVRSVAAASCGQSAQTCLPVTISPGFTASPSGTATICNGNSTNITFNFSAGTSPYDVNWTAGTLNGILSGHTETVSPTTTTTYTITSAIDANGCAATPGSPVTITVINPLNVGNVSAPPIVCQGSTQTYSVSPVAGATEYDWTVPNGAIITNAPPYGSSINVNWPAGAESGDVCTAAVNACGPGAQNCRMVTFIPLPVAPAAINGPLEVCRSSSEDFSIDPVPDAVSYQWTVPSGATISSGQGTTDITVIFSASAQSGNVCVRSVAANSCGQSAQTCLSVTTFAQPVQPVFSAGANTMPCEGSTAIYSVTPQASVDDYLWDTQGNGDIISGQGTSSVTIQWTLSGSTTLIVTANSTLCSNSATKNLSVNVRPLPETIAEVTGDEVTCTGSTVTYTADPVPGATSYTWEIPAIAQLIGNATGNTLTLKWLSTGVTTFGVYANNSCGAGQPYFITVVINEPPLQPGMITGPASVCSGSHATYSIADVVDASSYSWTVPAGANIVSGQGTKTVQVNFTTGSSGQVCVAAVNNCGSSPVRCIMVNVGTGAALSVGTINGPAVFCPVQNDVYSITTVPGATGYSWTVPAGASIVSGQNTTAVTVQWGATTGGQICVSAIGSCGSGTPGCMSVAPLAGSIVYLGPDTTLCPGSMLLLDAGTSGNTYSWNTGATTNALNVTISGAYTVTVTSGAGNTCVISDAVAVTFAAMAPPSVVIGLTQPSVTANVPVNTALTWTSSGGCTGGYFINIGTTPGGTDIVNNTNAGNINTWQPATNLPGGTTIYVTITPYNSAGNGPAATFSFVTAGGADVIPPTIDCPPSITLDLAAGISDTVQIFTVTAIDNFPDFTITQLTGLPSGESFPIGNTINTFLCTDQAGNTSSCLFSISVVEYSFVLVCEDVFVNCNFTAQPGDMAAIVDQNISFPSFNIVDQNTSGATVNVTFPPNVNIFGLTVKFLTNHTNIGDLEAFLSNPLGDTIQLFSRPGNGGCAGDSLDVVFDDASALTSDNLVNTCGNNPAIAGTFQSVGPIGPLLNHPVNGDWKITVIDHSAGGVGLCNVALQFTVSAPIPFPNMLVQNQNVFPGGTGYIVIAGAGMPVLDPVSASSLDYFDNHTNGSCAGVYGITNRTWTATDANGNTVTCVQKISFINPVMSDVRLPPDYDDIDQPSLPCSLPIYPTPAWLHAVGLQGSPLIFGSTFGCTINWEYEDSLINVCDGAFEIFRKWIVTDWCLGQSFEHYQIIAVSDKQGPILSCPANLTVKTDTFSCCATVNLPDVILMDSCSRINAVTAMVTAIDPVTLDTIGFFPVNGSLTSFPGNDVLIPDTLAIFGNTLCLPLGTHTVMYTAFDDCGKSSSCTFLLTIVDSATCVSLLMPNNNANNININTGLQWESASNCTDGYRISMGTTTGGIDLLDNLDVGNVTSFQPAQPFPSGSTIYVSIVPYNSFGSTTGCQEFNFSTAGVPTCNIVISCMPTLTLNTVCPEETVPNYLSLVTIVENCLPNTVITQSNLGVALGNTTAINYEPTPIVTAADPTYGSEFFITFTATDGTNTSQPCSTRVTLEDNDAPVPDTFPLEDLIVNCDAAIIDAPTAVADCNLGMPIYGIPDGVTIIPYETLPGNPSVVTRYKLTNLPGTYYIIWSYNDASGNVTTQLQKLTINASSLAVQIVGPNALCSGSGTLQLGSYNQYLWSGGETTESVNISQVGTYSVTVTDTYGCIGTDEITITGNATAPSPAITGPTSLCPDIAALQTGTFAQYLWSNNATTSSITVNQTGIYTITVTDVNGCTGTSSQTISGTANPPSPAITGPTALCSGNATLQTGNFAQYLWSNNATTQNISVNQPGAYIVTVTNTDGCTGTDTHNVGSSVPAPVPTISISSQQCAGPATLETGAFAGYFWSDNQTTSGITITQSGNYTVTATEANGCTGTASYAYTLPPLLNATAIPINPASCATPDGSVDIEIVSGTAPFQYMWNNGATTQNLTNLDSGSYIVTITDANNCVFTSTSTLTAPGAPVIVPVPVDATCQQNNGSITLDVSGINGIPVFIWSNGATTSGITNLSPGIYTATVTAPNMCNSVVSSEIVATGPSAPQPAIAGVQIICGDSTVLMTGPFATYLWSNNATTSFLTVNSIGFYTVTVTDANGCTGTATHEITTQQPLPSPEITGGSLICSNPLTLTLSQSYPDILWTGGQTSPSLQVNAPGVYAVTVTDPAGCTGAAAITVADGTSQTLSVDPGGTVSICAGDIISLSSAVVPGYSYQWALDNADIPGAVSPVYEASVPGVYVLTGSFNGCVIKSQPTQVTVTALPVVAISAAGSMQFCEGGMVTLNAPQNSSVQYQWQKDGQTINGAASAGYTANTTGLYQLVVTEAGCEGVSNVIVIDVLPRPFITVDTIKSAFCEEDNGAIELSIANASGNVTYDWTNGSETKDLINVPPGDYQITVTGGNACTSTAMLTIPDVPVPQPVINGPDEVIPGERIILNTDQTYPEFSWSTGAVSPTIDVKIAGIYTVTVTDINGCTASAEKTIKTDLDHFLDGAEDIIPRAFTPVSSPGQNDDFDPVKALENAGRPVYLASKISMIVWVRNQEAILKLDPYMEGGWQHTLVDDALPEGTYYYILEFEFPDGKRARYKAAVNLIR